MGRIGVAPQLEIARSADAARLLRRRDHDRRHCRARRASTPRSTDFLDQTSAPLDVTSTGTGDDLSIYDGSRDLAGDMAGVPGVEGVTPVTWMGVAAEANGVVLPAFAIREWGRGVGDRPPAGAIVLRGRMPDPAHPDEIALNEVGVDELGADVGDRVVLKLIRRRPGPSIPELGRRATPRTPRGG